MDADIKVALGLLDARRVAGDPDLAERVLTAPSTSGRPGPAGGCRRVDEVTRARHHRFGDLAFLLEPDLKEARGGQRDLHLLRSLGRVVPVLAGVLDDPALAGGGRRSWPPRGSSCSAPPAGPPTRCCSRTRTPWPPPCAYADADALMAALAERRPDAWPGLNDDGWRRLESWLAGPARRAGGRDHPLEPGLVLRDGEVTLLADAPVATDTSLALRTAAASAELDKPMARSTLDRLAVEAAVPGGCLAARDAAAPCCGCSAPGRPAVAAIESLDQLGVWVRYLPEWAPIRNKPQRNAYHRFTVDRHLLETAAGAAPLTRAVARPDLLLLGALLHDIGKGRGGDHTDDRHRGGRELGPRLGLSDGRRRHPADAGPLPPAAAGSGHPARPRRPGDRRRGRRRRRRPGHPGPAGRPDRGRQPGDRAVGLGTVEGRPGRPAGRADRGHPGGPPASRRPDRQRSGPSSEALLAAGRLQLCGRRQPAHRGRTRPARAAGHGGGRPHPGRG